MPTSPINRAATRRITSMKLIRRASTPWGLGGGTFTLQGDDPGSKVM